MERVPGVGEGEELDDAEGRWAQLRAGVPRLDLRVQPGDQRLSLGARDLRHVVEVDRVGRVDLAGHLSEAARLVPHLGVRVEDEPLGMAAGERFDHLVVARAPCEPPRLDRLDEAPALRRHQRLPLGPEPADHLAKQAGVPLLDQLLPQLGEKRRVEVGEELRPRAA